MMASVHKQPRSEFFFAHFRIPDGVTEDGKIRWKLIKRTTKRTKFDEAMVVAKEFEALARAEAGASSAKGRKYTQILREAVEHAADGLLNVRVATEHLQRLSEAATGQPMVTYTIESWLRVWLHSKSGSQRSTATVVRYTGVVESFLNTLTAERKSAPLQSVGFEDLTLFQSEGIGKAPATLNLAIKTLSMAFGRAVELGHLKLNPTKAIDRIPTESIAKDVFSPDQVAKLVKAAEGDWKGVILFGFFTGMRLRDIANLQWANVEGEMERVKFKVAKTGKQLVVPLHDRVRQFLKARSKSAGTHGPIFPQLHGKGTGGSKGMSMSFARIMAQAEVAGEKVAAAGKKGRLRNSLSFHSLRHSFTSYLANAGVAEEIRQKLTGHLDRKTHQLYTHAELTTLKQAIDLLPVL